MSDGICYGWSLGMVVSAPGGVKNNYSGHALLMIRIYMYMSKMVKNRFSSIIVISYT